MLDYIISKPELLWFAIGLVLLLMELVVPGFFIFFFGLGAWVTALVCLIGEPSTNLQIIIFAITSVISLIGLRQIIQKKFFYSKGKESEEVEDEFTGKEALALSDFGDQINGKVEFKGTTWTSESKSEIKAGQRVIIIEKDSFKLLVKPKK
ncbi:MAG: NfeD family protein [Bacteroidales bacterium]|nr:NfeD family protein [Bacteroidales bacterium]MBK7626187.1 NfeD family protein [Bacteroidales bacterium]